MVKAPKQQSTSSVSWWCIREENERGKRVTTVRRAANQTRCGVCVCVCVCRVLAKPRATKDKIQVLL